jgi:hypothetical protein
MMAGPISHAREWQLQVKSAGLVAEAGMTGIGAFLPLIERSANAHKCALTPHLWAQQFAYD